MERRLRNRRGDIQAVQAHTGVEAASLRVAGDTHNERGSREAPKPGRVE